MNIGIFEKEHFEVAYPMLRICDKPEHQLTVFVDETTYERLLDLLGDDFKRYQWVVQQNNVSNRQFVSSIHDVCKKNKIEILFLNTVSNNYIFYALLAKRLPLTKVIVTIHDANNFFRSTFSVNVRRSIRHVGKKLLDRYTYAYNTLGDSVREYLIKSIGVKKKVYCIPGAVYEVNPGKIKDLSSGEQLKIVVPGTIDKRRRDYDFVFSLMKRINEHHLPVHIVLLGTANDEYGENILKQSEEYSTNHKNITYYSGKLVNQEEYDRQLRDCHFIFIPSVIKTMISDNIEETYGLTKSSGNIYDAVKHGKPMIIPAALKINTNLETGVMKYDNLDQLVELLKTMILGNENYNQLSAKARINSEAYTIERCRNRISELL